MKKIAICFLGALLIVIILFKIDLPLSDLEIKGRYVNKNFDRSPCCVEAPHVADTIILNPDKTFYSAFYGKGEFKIKRIFLLTEISILTMDENGGAQLSTYFTNGLFEKPRIILNWDLNHYYEKLD